MPENKELIPEGWRLVPVEPTEAMLDAGVDQFRRTREAGGGFGYSLEPAYRAMLAAAPQPSKERTDRDWLVSVLRELAQAATNYMTPNTGDDPHRLAAAIAWAERTIDVWPPRPEPRRTPGFFKDPRP